MIALGGGISRAGTSPSATEASSPGQRQRGHQQAPQVEPGRAGARGERDRPPLARIGFRQIRHRPLAFAWVSTATRLALASAGLARIDIYPGATVDGRFFVDHGTDAVIGETAVIGESSKTL